jgi:hypothetical protein
MALFKKKKSKEDEFLDIDDDLDDDKGSYGPAGKHAPKSEPSSGMPAMPSPPTSFAQRDTELLTAKIDALKAEIESLKTRISVLEQRTHAKKQEEMGEKYGKKPDGGGWHY